MISVTIPIFNVVRYLDYCVSSIVNQTFKDIEIILVDDGSTDGCQLLCDEWARKDNRIKVVHQENKGLYMARRAGALNATGDYVLSIDADDWLDYDACEKIALAITQTSADVIQYGLHVETANVNDSDVQFYERWFNVATNHLEGSDEIFEKCYAKREIPWNVATKAIRASIIKKAYNNIGEYRINQLEDYLTTISVFQNCKTWHRVDGKFYHYRYGIGMSTNIKPMSLNALNEKLGYYPAFEELKKKITATYAPDTVVYRVFMNEISTYIHNEREAQLIRNRFYPQYYCKQVHHINICEAFLDSATNYEYDIKRSVAVHLHIYGSNSIAQYRDAFRNIPVCFDLFISIPESIKIYETDIREKFLGISNLREIVIERVPDKGGDIAPLLCVFKEQMIKYDIIFHSHTRFVPVKNYTEKKDGSEYCGLLNSKWVNTILLMLSEDAGLVLLPFSYPEASIFWARTDVLRPFFNLTLSYGDFSSNILGMECRLVRSLKKRIFIWGTNSGRRIFEVYHSEKERKAMKHKRKENLIYKILFGISLLFLLLYVILLLL